MTMSISVRAGFDRAANLLHALRERREPGGEAGGDCRDGNLCAFERLDRGFDEGVVDADGAGGQTQLFNAEASRQCARCSGWRALAQRRCTRSAVSSPLSVVRSMQAIARSSHAACHSFFTVRRVPWSRRGVRPRWC